MTRMIVVAGTDTDVGKTVATAAITSIEMATGQRVLVVKPVQTGAGDDTSDAAVVRRLAGCDVATLAALNEPLAPETAARRAGVTLPTVADLAREIRSLTPAYDVVIVEGAGGVLVRLDNQGGTIIDLTLALSAAEPRTSPAVVVVTRAGVGSLNHAELTVEALRQRGVEPNGLIVGSWPHSPGLAERCNADDLPRVTGVPVLASIPERAGSLAPEAFRAAAPGWVHAAYETLRRPEGHEAEA